MPLNFHPPSTVITLLSILMRDPSSVFPKHNSSRHSRQHVLSNSLRLVPLAYAHPQTACTQNLPQIWTHTYTCTCTHIHMHIHTHVHTHVHIRIYTYIHIHTCLRYCHPQTTQVLLCSCSTHTCTHTRTHVHTHLPASQLPTDHPSAALWLQYTHTYTHTHTRTHTLACVTVAQTTQVLLCGCSTHTYTHTHAHTHTCLRHCCPQTTQMLLRDRTQRASIYLRKGQVA